MSCMSERKKKILRHCIRKCAWDEDMTHCTGCKLTKNQLKNWYRMTDNEKKAALEAAEKIMPPSSNG